ncbi:hypothetical protein KAR91_02470 [Candidatus Pacearchaeota archaeon]|nr:hypothetical protein [Candidatus Pacearchaeota archaeon]
MGIFPDGLPYCIAYIKQCQNGGEWVQSHKIPVEILNKKIKNKHGDFIESSVIYPYMEDKGGVFCYKARFEWEDLSTEKGRDKDFRYYSIINGKAKASLSRSSFYPVFRADEIAKLDRNITLVFVEGEKAAKCQLAKITEGAGYFFTTTIDFKKTDFTAVKRFKNILIVPDKDETGENKSLSLKAILSHARIIEPPEELPHKGDIADLEWESGLDLYLETAEDFLYDNSEKERIEAVIESIDGYTFSFDFKSKMLLANTEEAKQFTIIKEHKQAAELVTIAFKENVIYCDAEKKFFYFNGNVWLELVSIIDAVLSVLYGVSKVIFAGSDNKEMITVLKTISKKGYADAVIGILKQKNEIYMKQVQWNHNQTGKWVLKDEIIMLNKNGTIKGRKGERGEYFNNPLPYTKDQIIKAPEPTKYIEDLKIYFPDEKTRETGEYLLSVLFSGDVGFKKVPIMVGLSDTGKSTLLKALGHGVFPGLFDTINAEVVCPAERKYDNGEAPSPQLVKLIDHRVLGVFEIEQGRRAATGLLKTVSGGDPITARRLRENPITFNPSAYIVLCTNYLPSFGGGDSAFCNRLIILPFTNPIPITSQRTQEEIIEEFRDEAPGIIKRMIHHYKELVMDHGRIIPESDQCMVRKNKYIKTNDDIGLFITTCLDVNMDKEYEEPLESVARVYRSFFSLSEKEAKNSKISKLLINRMEEIESGRKRDKGSQKLIGVLKNVKLKEEYKNVHNSVDELDVSPAEYKPENDPKYHNDNSDQYNVYQ